MWSLRPLQRYLAVKGNKVPIRGTTWMNLENMLSAEARHERTTIVGCHLHEVLRIRQIGDRKHIRGYQQGVGRGGGSYCLMVLEFLFGVFKSLELDSGGGCATLNIIQASGFYI